jgi:hypothetical protein
VQVLKYRACQYAEPVLVELISELHRIRRQVAIRTEFDPLIAGLSDFAKENLRRYLLRITRKPDSPGVWSGADRDRG